MKVGLHWQKTGGGGGCGDDRDGGAQCRAPCLRGTCEAWGGPGWWGDPVLAGRDQGRCGGRPAMDFTFVVGFKRVRIELGGRGLQAEDKKKTEQDVRMRR